MPSAWLNVLYTFIKSVFVIILGVSCNDFWQGADRETEVQRVCMQEPQNVFLENRIKRETNFVTKMFDIHG